MPKFIMSMRDKTFQLLSEEAQKRNVSVQELLRAVIVPEWVRTSLEDSFMHSAGKEIDSQTKPSSEYNLRQEPTLETPIARSKRQLTSYLWSSTKKDG